MVFRKDTRQENPRNEWNLAQTARSESQYEHQPTLKFGFSLALNDGRIKTCTWILCHETSFNFERMCDIDPFLFAGLQHNLGMQLNMREYLKLEQIHAVPCPTCGAKAGEKCELNSGQARTAPHRDRRLNAEDLAN
jgi:hypothetical protein